jgi:hypothetical protein
MQTDVRPEDRLPQTSTMAPRLIPAGKSRCKFLTYKGLNFGSCCRPASSEARMQFGIFAISSPMPSVPHQPSQSNP